MPAANKVVARFLDGRVLKGTTLDFVPTRPHFHVTPVNAASGDRPVQVDPKELKALFFVKGLSQRAPEMLAILFYRKSFPLAFL